MTPRRIAGAAAGLALLAALPLAASPAEPDAAPQPAPTPVDAADDNKKKDEEQPPVTMPKSVFSNLYRTVDEFALVNSLPRLSFHKPSYVLPISYTPRYESDETEFIFQLSLKLQLFKMPLYFGYTQHSFWQIYNAQESRPFRETNYNPELFYRWKPEYAACPGCGFDLGVEHESNGREAPQSRSWNRVSVAAYHESAKTLLHLKAWYRIPEDRKKDPNDADGDDNPDISRYMGHGELRIQRELFSDHLAALMLRGNARTGKGAVELNYSAPFGDYLFWNVYIFNGYGETLSDYNRSLTRYGIGVMLVR